MPVNTWTIPALLDHLRATPPSGGRMLTVYLDTSPRRVQGQAYRLAFEAGRDAVRGILPSDEAPRFAAVAERVASILAEEVIPRGQGLAIFAADAPDAVHTIVLPRPPVDSVAWETGPQLEPLQALVDDAERIAVVLIDKERARLFTIFLGQIEERTALVDAVPGKQATGGWFALAQARYARHHEEMVIRHVKHTARVLLDVLRTHPFDRLLVGGPDEALALLRHHLPGPLRARLAGTLTLPLAASDATVLAASLPVAAVIERRVEAALVDELVASASLPHVVLGHAPTLAAVADGRVHHLVLADAFAGIGGECPRCGRLVAGVGACPTCGEPTTPVDDLRERLLAQALAQGARVEIVAGEAAALLMVHGGLGAWTRY